MGDDAGRYGDSRYNDIVNESFNVDTSEDGSQITVRSLGETDTYAASEVKKIVAYGGGGNDFVYVGRNVKAQLDFEGGAGNDSFMVLGGAAGSKVFGGAGKDEFVSGGISGILFRGGDGKDKFIGGEADDDIDMGAGANTIYGGGGNDTIRLVSGASDVVDAGDGDDLILAPLLGSLELDAGDGNDRLVIDDFVSTAPVQLNDHALVVTSGSADERSVSFNDKLERIELRDNAATTVLKSGANASWGSTDLILDAAGLLDVRQAQIVAPQALFSVQAAGIQGTLRTNVSDLTVVNLGTAGAPYGDIVLREADVVDIEASGRTNGGLYAANGKIDVEVAGREALLTLRSGVISTGSGGGAITLVADDLDFASGENQVSGSGALVIRSKAEAQGYRLGGAAESLYGVDNSTAGPTGFLDLGMRDLSALRDGFSSITIGHRSAAAGNLQLVSGEVQDEFADYFNTLPGNNIVGTDGNSVEIADPAQVSAVIAALAQGTIHADLRAKFTGGRVPALGSGAALIPVANFVAFAELPAEVRQQIATSKGYTTYTDGGFFNPETGRFFERVTPGPVVDSAAAAGYTRYDGTVYYNPLAAAGRQVLTAFEQGVSADYDNARIEWAAAGVPAPAPGTTFEGLTPEQRLVVANALGYAWDYGQIPIDTWASAPFDYAQVPMQEWIDASTLDFAVAISSDQWGSVPKPVGGTPYALMTAAQQAVVDRWVEFSPMQVDRLTLTGEFKAGDKLAVTVNGTRVEVTVAGSDVVAPADANNPDQVKQALMATRAKVAERLAAALNALPSVAAKVTASTAGELLRVRSDVATENYTLTLDDGERRVEQVSIARKEYVDLNLDQKLVVVGKLRPSLDTPYKSLTAAQKQVVGNALSTATKVQYFNYGATPGKKLVETFTQGVVTDYRNVEMTWGAAGAPGAAASFASLTQEQKDVVARSLGYERHTGTWYLKADAVPSERWVSGFTAGGGVYDPATMDWGGAAAPADATGFEGLTIAQREVVLRELGYSAVDREVYLKADAAPGKKVVDGFVEGFVDGFVIRFAAEHLEGCLRLGGEEGVERLLRRLVEAELRRLTTRLPHRIPCRHALYVDWIEPHTVHRAFFAAAPWAVVAADPAPLAELRLRRRHRVHARAPGGRDPYRHRIDLDALSLNLESDEIFMIDVRDAVHGARVDCLLHHHRVIAVLVEDTGAASVLVHVKGAPRHLSTVRAPNAGKLVDIHEAQQERPTILIDAELGVRRHVRVHVTIGKRLW